ncbi:MAG TPA: glycosyl hydrolase, partial [Elusimicrobiota bacterium]|nr:glycosyl hydrolase [Elusimicrobiota bacterium]
AQHIAADDKTWADSYAPGLPPGAAAVSPAASSVNSWYQDFIKSPGAAQFPFVAIHLYEDIQANDPGSVDHAVADFERRLKQVGASKKPVWVTEFGLATWRATKDDPAKFTDEQAACFMAQAVPFLEKHSMRYAWFSPGPDAKDPLYPTLPDALWNLDGSLTPLGELYRQ